MKNKIEFKKTMLLSCIVIIVVSAIFQFYLLYQCKVYTGNFKKKIGMIVTNVQNQYPNIDKNELIQILNNQENVETGLLKQYGINLENDSIIIQNDKMFVKFSIINLCFIIGLAMAVLLIFVKYTNSKDKKLGEITKYIEENSKPDIIINMGYVGSTNEKIGSWINVNKSYNYEWNIPGEQRYIIENNNEKLGNQELELIENDKIKKIPCYTAESFVTSTDITEEVLFDMELHSLAIICDIYKIKLLSLKKVSDNLSLSGYYDNLDKKEIFELTSGLEFIKDMLI